MFSKSTPPHNDEFGIPAPVADRSTFSVFGSDVAIKGNVEATADLHVDGRVEGDIKCAVLVQGANSTIKGGVMADQARIAGTIEGSVAAKEIIVEATARVIGDVVYEKISVAAGGHIDGSFKHKSAGTIRAEDAGLKLVETAVKDAPLPKEEPQAKAY